MVVIEDVHWADEATLDLLVFLGRRLADTPSVLVAHAAASTRPDPPPRLTEVTWATSRGRHGSVRLPLSTPEPSTPCRARRGARRHARTGARGHRPATRSSSPRCSPPGATRCPPRSGTRSLGRATALSEGARAALEAAAVVPDRIELDLLYAVSGAARTISRSASGPTCWRSGRASRRTVTSSRATPSSTTCPPSRRQRAARGRRRRTCSPPPGTTSRGSRTTPTSPATRPRCSPTPSIAAEQSGPARRPPRGGRADGPRARPPRGSRPRPRQPRSSGARPRAYQADAGDWTTALDASGACHRHPSAAG